jgi:hypothetical protein
MSNISITDAETGRYVYQHYANGCGLLFCFSGPAGHHVCFGRARMEDLSHEWGKCVLACAHVRVLALGR